MKAEHWCDMHDFSPDDLAHANEHVKVLKVN